MHIETYIIEETQELIYDGDKLKEWNDIVSELGLTGQNKITNGNKSPIPFLPINATMQNILKELCPATVRIENYNLTPVPLEILKLVALARREGHFKLVEIWYDERSKDPVCVGETNPYFVDNQNGHKMTEYGTFATDQDCKDFIKEKGLEGHKPYRYGGEKYLIGRWADVKQSFDELAERAKKRFVDSETASLSKQMNELRARIDSIKDEAVIKFGV